MSKLRVLFIGPFPPKLGGAIVESLMLWNYLNEHADVDASRISTNSSFLSRYLVPLKILFTIPRVETVFLYGSHRGVSCFSVLLVPICLLFGKRCVIKITGGNLWEYYESSNYIWKAILQKTLFGRCLLLLETKYLINRFENDANNIQWFPMTRKSLEKDRKPRSQKRTTSGSEDNTDLKVVYFGHIRVQKGIHELIEASNRFENITIDAYGEFLDLEPSVFNAGKVNYKGVVQPNEVFATMSKYDVLVMPTFYPGEGYPGVIIEAKNAGLAVVATSWRSIPEIVTDEVDGILIMPKDVDALAIALVRLKNDRELLMALQENSARSFYDHNIEKWGAVLIDFLRKA